MKYLGREAGEETAQIGVHLARVDAENHVRLLPPLTKPLEVLVDILLYLVRPKHQGY